MRGWGQGEWLPPVLAAIAFVAFAAVFAVEILAHQRAVVGWAQRDLDARAALAAANLEEPLLTEDFRALGEFGAACAADGVRLRVRGDRGGLVYDSAPGAEGDWAYWGECARGEWRVAIAVPASRVLAPFRRALVGFALAGFVGVFGVVLVFLSFYRQRVRIRELGRLERFRREFVADVSHEIKTPLTGILGAVDLLGDEKLPAAARNRLLGMVKGESTRLNALVQGILALARLERDDFGLNAAPTDVALLVREAVARFRDEATKAGVALGCRVPDGPEWARVDAQLVEQALANLIRNAIRHSGSKTVAVTLAAEGKSLSFAVEDRGVGIPAEHRARVFERFHRVDAARASSTGGTGLGLAIVRRIARLHGGEVRLEPVEPSGCRFVVTLPRVRFSLVTRDWPLGGFPLGENRTQGLGVGQ